MPETQNNIEFVDFSNQIDQWIKSTKPERYRISHLPKIDKFSGSFAKGSLNLIVAKSGFGKSNLLIDISAKLAIEMKPVLFFSCEMPDYILMPRIVANLLKMPIPDVVRLKDDFDQTPEDKKLEHPITQAITVAASLPLEIMYTQKIEEIIAKAIEYKQKYNICHVVIDHFFELQSDINFGSDTEKERHFISEVEKLAKTHDLCILIATQFKKGSEKDGDFGNRDLDDVRGASEIRNKATTIFYLYETKNQNKVNRQFLGQDVAHKCMIKLLKARNGVEGAAVPILYDRMRFRFAEAPLQDSDQEPLLQ